MDELWESQLPGEYRNRVIRPIPFEPHTEPAAIAAGTIGFGSCGIKCFAFLSFVLTEEGLDAEELPILVDVFCERVFAWRLLHGRSGSKAYSARLDR